MKDLLNFLDKPQSPLSIKGIQVSLASAEKIKSWSFGEVKKPETINYRTFKPEREGLFCAKIFGPIKDYECLCGKYKRMKYRGVICEKCGVEVTRSKVRRERMGHISLVSPVAHVWFLRSLPSRIVTLLGMTLKELEAVLYCESHMVLDPMETELKEMQVLSENEYQDALDEYGPHFRVGMGGEAVIEMLRSLDLEFLARQLRIDIRDTKSELTKKKLAKRLKIVEAFRGSNNKPEWMILTVLPVIPPDLRPLVHLDGGRFATSDLNDLYRRVINRNNRLKKLQDLNAPDIIIRNEKRMLQEAVDALLDNGRGGKVFTGANKRPLRSLSDALKGKQGRFRQNLLGKRVDYSGRSVIVVGPHLRLHQCGLPKKMALELFKPFICGQLEARGLVTTVKQAKRLIDEGVDEVWDILSEVVKEHPVLLNRAPTLHRLGIQAFEPLLHEGKAIQLHPLVCAAFNADFDGDTMSVHVPLSIEAQIEARVLMMSTNNILSPSNGKPVINPTQDMVLGLYWMTRINLEAKGTGRIFSSIDKVEYAYNQGLVNLQAAVKVKIGNTVYDTSVGRAILGGKLPKDLDFKVVNKVMNKKTLAELMDFCFRNVGPKATVLLADALKQAGFEYSTQAGISIAIGDLKIPKEKDAILASAVSQVQNIQEQYDEGLTTESERYNKAVDIWSNATDKVAKVMMKHFETQDFEVDGKTVKSDSFNSIYIMADSGARGAVDQIKQLAGMRGLLAKPSGEIIETPITANYREGLSVIQYFIATHGARKGLADTALKTANSGYLTRCLVDVAQDVVVTKKDCGTSGGIVVRALVEGGEIIQSLGEKILGRITLKPIMDPATKTIIVDSNEEITEDAVQKIYESEIEEVVVRSPLTCQSDRGICVQCYGRDLSRGHIVNLGEAVGIIAAQSIGEPGTQLTMRTFHLGGAASRSVEESEYLAKYSGTVCLNKVQTVINKEGKVTILGRNGILSINAEDGVEKEAFKLPYGSVLHYKIGAKVKAKDTLSTWDPYSKFTIAAAGGFVKFVGLDLGVTYTEERDTTTGFIAKKIINNKSLDGSKPSVHLVDKTGQPIQFERGGNISYILSTGVQLLVDNGQEIFAGDLITKMVKESSKTKDITGGLPRVKELFEARVPKDPSVMAPIDGYVSFGEDLKDKQRIIITAESGDTSEVFVPKGKNAEVMEGEFIKAGESVVDGETNPHDLLDIQGEVALSTYLLNEVQEVYRLQGVAINDKHIETILRQMLSKVRVLSAGDTPLIQGEVIEKARFKAANKAVTAEDGELATGQPVLLGITKTSLSTESWLSAASFQEVTKVLTEASINSKMDNLKGLKENIIMGRLIPAGTGLPCYSQWKIGVDAPKPKEVDAVLPGVETHKNSVVTESEEERKNL
ncbi:MAG: DNA-directed RNA polymerase subunit beta' [Bdellovibrionaceae bacterium]|nr:DNA-directed RNA polymerase subunit beta' [Pseudobdellovibrionaceae bacterium]